MILMTFVRIYAAIRLAGTLLIRGDPDFACTAYGIMLIDAQFVRHFRHETVSICRGGGEGGWHEIHQLATPSGVGNINSSNLCIGRRIERWLLIL